MDLQKEAMVVLAGIAMGNVTDGESRTMLHLANSELSCDVEVTPRVLQELERRKLIEIDNGTTAIKVTVRGAKAIKRWQHKNDKAIKKHSRASKPRIKRR